MAKTSIREVFNEFCESTSLHGYTYWYNADSIILKVAWAFAILAATCIGAMFLANQTKEYLDGEILTTIETSTAPLDVSMYILQLKAYTRYPQTVSSLPFHTTLAFKNFVEIWYTKIFPIVGHYMAICHNL